MGVNLNFWDWFETDIYIFLYKKNNFSYKSRNEKYLKLISLYLSVDMYIELTHMKNLYGQITCIYEKARVIVM
jgi:hypothetical protein